MMLNKPVHPEMRSSRWKSDGVLFLASLIWGFAFVAQRKGMEHIGPFLFNGLRFFLGAVVLVPFLKMRSGSFPLITSFKINFHKKFIILGLLLFGGASLQQVGIVTTTAGKAGFITGLYVILVPILGIFFSKKTHIYTWIGALLAVLGLYFLSIKSDLSIATGDLLVLVGAFFWASHVLMIDHLTQDNDPLWLAFTQFMICSLISMVVAVWKEPIVWDYIRQASVPILYAGILSSGVAYTLQVIGQKEAHPSHAAIILSLESPFAALGGWLLLHEHLTTREFMGSILMLAGMLVSQMYLIKNKRE